MAVYTADNCIFSRHGGEIPIQTPSGLLENPGSDLEVGSGRNSPSIKRTSVGHRLSFAVTIGRKGH